MAEEIKSTQQTTLYDDSSISALIGAERVRKRPAAMLGSSGLAGARHGFTEIYGNALDEATSGYGDRLDVTYHTDGSISVRDYGRGVPLSWNEALKTWNWHSIYDDLYAGGKYETNQSKLARQDWSKFNAKDYNYLYSVGLNGLGAASTQYTSEFFTVKSFRDGVVRSRSFQGGYPLSNGKLINVFNMTSEAVKKIPEEIEETTEPNGTYIHWKPDSRVFSDVNIGGDWLFKTCKYIASVAGITLHFVDETTGKDITLEKGTITDIIKDTTGSENIFSMHTLTHGTTIVEGKDFTYVCEADIVFTPTDKRVDTLCFHNSVQMHNGVQFEGVDDAITTFLTEIAKRRGIKLDIRDYDTAFGVVVSSFSNYVSFRNQTKDGVDDKFIYKAIYTVLLDKLKQEYAKGNRSIIDTVEKVMREAEVRIALREQEKLIRDVKKVTREKAPEKFVSCDAYEKKQYDKAELWITEGDSAKGAVKSARNKEFQAIYPIRGKGINVLKKSIDKVLKNKEIRDIFALLGTGFDLGVKGEKLFNIEDLKFNKIIFATDADEDGYQIRVLLFLTFYKLAPELIRQGHVYIAETPRFQIKLVDGKTLYAKNDAERDKQLHIHRGRVAKVSRFKGLGEVNADVLRETTVHPDTRNLIPVTCDLENEAERFLIDALFGADKYKQRKQIIADLLGEEVASMMQENALMFGEIEEEDIDDGIEYEKVGGDN